MKWTKLLLAMLVLITLQQSTHAQSGSWSKAGNSLSGTEKLGSTNAQPVRFFTNNAQRMTLDASGKLGIGTTTPKVKLHIAAGTSNTPLMGNTTCIVESSSDNFFSLSTAAGKRLGFLFGVG